MEYLDSSYRPWAEEMVVVLADEEEHYDSGVENLRRFARCPDTLAEFQEVFDEMLPNAVKRAFGRPGGADNEFCLKTGLKRHTTEEVVNRYLDEMKGYMLETGLKFPALSQFEKLGAELSPSTSEILRSVQ